MNVKDEENQLRSRLNFQVLVCILVWLAFASFIFYRLEKLSRQKATVPPLKVAEIKQENISVLRGSIKAMSQVNPGLVIIRAEPFD